MPFPSQTLETMKGGSGHKGGPNSGKESQPKEIKHELLEALINEVFLRGQLSLGEEGQYQNSSYFLVYTR